MSEPDVAIVGAGAAGLATAIFAARRAPGLRIVLLESARTPGAKILISGGGRCNLTNREVGPADFWQPSSATVRRVLKALPVSETVRFFAELGVSVHEEPDGKLFPDSNRARTVLDALLGEQRRLGVELRCSARVETITKVAGGFELQTHAGPLRAGRVVLTTGGRSVPKSGSDGHGYELARSLGHGLVPPTPALAPLVLEGDFHSKLMGVTLPAELGLSGAGEHPRRLRGSLLFTHFGLSGPLALDASRFWHRARLEGRALQLTLGFYPGLDFAAVETQLLRTAGERPGLTLLGALRQDFAQSLAEALLGALGLSLEGTLGRLTRDDRRRLVAGLTAWPVQVRDSRGYNFAEATSGGVPLSEVEAGGLVSRLCPGLHFAGEILDVDGRLGGFNFQWAWSSGFVVGRALAG